MYLNVNFDFKPYVAMYIKNVNIWFNGHLNASANVGNALMSVQSSHILFDGRVTISHNTADDIMVFQSSNILFNGPMTISYNRASVMQMHSCDVTFNSSVNIHDNKHY